ncbi:MAG: ATP-binding cassette domain-containing protein [Ancrocorticia populi]|uniref:ATP-binding cassette domain-containing protein n=1 Tax=Ancrocorticia populi TaxID=2175228 RepID=UPI003F90DA7E
MLEEHGAGVIRVRGARENNLKNVDVDIPKRQLTVFTGVSGSGKSSLVFDTVAAESRRLINETYPAFVQGFMPTLDRPDVDELVGITTAITVDQERMGANPRSTVGTATDVGAQLRILFSRLGTPYWGPPQAFSFNVPTVTGTGAMKVQKGGSVQPVKKTFTALGGMCARCEGLGRINDIDLDEVFDSSKSLNEDPFKIPGYKMDGWNWKIYAQSGLVNPNKKIADFSKRELHNLLYAESQKIRFADMNMTYEGLIPRLEKSMLHKERDSLQVAARSFVERAVVFKICPDCEGSRLCEGARASLIDGVSIADVSEMQIDEASAWVKTVSDRSVAPLVAALSEILDSFVDMGLGYLSLSRSAGTLSGGEAQRTKMIRHLGSALTDVTYVFDEPTIGLHPHDIEHMLELLEKLRDKGNTVLVVEHKPDVIRIADHVIDLGPRAGSQGGEVCFTGSVDELAASDTLTGKHLSDVVGLKETVRQPNGQLPIRNANANNLKDVSVDVPLGVLTAVTGVAGSGKSSLMHDSVGENVVVVDQSPIKSSRRSNPATYTGVLDPIRKAFAKANGVKPALFSPNSEGACENCKGAGVIYTDLGMMAGVTSVCEACEGKRFEPSVLEYKFGEKNISEVFEMPVDNALELFSDAKVPAAVKILRNLVDVGLGYVPLGQPLTSLSGGERQRLKLATHMSDKGGIYILDEPTSGLHLADVEQLLELLDRLVDSGKTVIVIEHHQAVVAHADWVIDLGPGAGRGGGTVVFEGTPRELAAGSETVTGEYLARYLGQ